MWCTVFCTLYTVYCIKLRWFTGKPKTRPMIWLIIFQEENLNDHNSTQLRNSWMLSDFDGAPDFVSDKLLQTMWRRKYCFLSTLCSLTGWTKIKWKTPLGICSIHCTALTLSWSLIYKLNFPFGRLLLGGPVFPAASMKLPAFRHVMYTRERLGGAPTRKQGIQNILKWPNRVPKLKGNHQK